ALAATDEGAIGALADGRLFTFHPREDEPLRLIDLGLGKDVSFAAGCGRLYVFDPAAPALRVYGADGALEASVEGGTLAAHGEGTALVADEAGARLMLVGGGAAGVAASLARLDEAGLTLSRVGALPS